MAGQFKSLIKELTDSSVMTYEERRSVEASLRNYKDSKDALEITDNAQAVANMIDGFLTKRVLDTVRSIKTMLDPSPELPTDEETPKKGKNPV